ncbi:hypothetical protein C2W64_01569 [Brevibacillus laterosporus]|nr:hypothetical protein C2W64_01569 [Brevibacillus laterosporus]
MFFRVLQGIGVFLRAINQSFHSTGEHPFFFVLFVILDGESQ